MSNNKRSPMATAFLAAALYAGGWGIGTAASNQLFNHHAPAADEAGAVFAVAAIITYQNESSKKRQPTL